MKKVVLIFSALFLMTGVFAQGTLPDVTVKTLDGENVKLDAIVKKGKITVLNFWATWCNPCKKELDVIKDMYEEWKELYDIEFIAISIDNAGTMKKVKPMVAQKQWEYTVFTDEQGDLMRALNFQTIPQTFLFDADRKIVYSHNGYNAGDEFELEDQIKKAAGK